MTSWFVCKSVPAVCMCPQDTFQGHLQKTEEKLKKDEEVLEDNRNLDCMLMTDSQRPF